MRRIIAGATALAVGLVLLPAATGQVEVVALPVTVAEQLDIELPTPARAQGATHAAPVTSEVMESPIPFSMLGFELPDGLDELRVRTSVDGDEWSPWTATERFDDEDGPDLHDREAASDRSHGFAEPVWVEEANYLQIEVPAAAAGLAGEVRAELIDSHGLSGGPVERRVVPRPAAADASERPRIITRAQWGADESWSRPTSTANEVHMGVVHHTATSNDYTDARAVMRAMYRYHTQNLGWADLGYNIVVDQQGNVYEGRAGGLENGVVGAHARGYNTGSFGVAVIGNFDQIRPPRAAVNAVVDVIAWQSRVYGIDPVGSTGKMSGGWRPTIVGHRDVGSTACPGQHFYPLLGEVREQAAAKMDARSPDEWTGDREIVPPKTTITSGPSGTVSENSATLRFSATGDVSFYECQFGGKWYACSSPRTFSDLGDGEHTFRARAVDPDGNREQAPATRTWTVETTVAAPSFPDVDGVHAPGIAAVAAAGITQGYNDGTFRPNLAVTRAQMATFLTRALELEPADDEHTFPDVDGVHAPGIAAVAAADITQGYNDGTFRPNLAVTRAQMATFLTRALELEPADDEHTFPDVDGVHAPGIAAVAAADITQGYNDGTFRPNLAVTRAQMATFLTRALELEVP
jgi:hypothetical protein